MRERRYCVKNLFRLCGFILKFYHEIKQLIEEEMENKKK